MTLIKSISGIRGTIGGVAEEGLTPPDVIKFTSSYGHWLKETNKKPKVVIGRDARISGSIVSSLVTATLQALGIDVINLGLSTTPTVEFAVKEEGASGGIIVTASHNPSHWNALKLLDSHGEFLSPLLSKKVLEYAETAQPKYATVQKLGSLEEIPDYIRRHINKILSLPLVNVDAIKEKGFRVVVDGINSTGSIAVPMLLESLGVEQVVTLNDEPNGAFAHNPEPLPENITEICRKLEVGNFHLGIIVDPDVDRLALVCEDGTPFGEEYTLVAVADYVLKFEKGNTVSNMSSTRALKDVTEKAGGKHFESAVGEINVVELMKKENAVIGGEGNGGVIYPRMQYGRDALAGIALFLSHLATFKGSSKMLKMTYPSYHISKNKIELTREINVDHVLEQVQQKYKSQPINTLDGVKIYFDKEWVHLRKSNTEPIIRIYAESESPATAEHLANKIIADIKEMIAFKAS